MRAFYAADLDNGWVITPQYGYYRMSDKEIDEAGSTSRYGLEVRYEMADPLDLIVQGTWQPKAVGYEAVLYQAGVAWEPFYYWAGIKNPVVTVKFGQERYHSYVDVNGQDLPEGAFKQVGTSVLSQLEFDVKRFHLQAAWQKVIKYSSRVPNDITFSWAEIPYMTAVLQGYLKDCYATRLSYQTDFITPYVSLARCHYDQRLEVAGAVSAGIHVKLWNAEVTGGVEVFEPRREDNRKTYFTLSVDVPM